MIYDLIIVGLGSHGSAIFDHFTQKMKVLAIEQYQSPHQRGSHTGDSRIVREMGYYTQDYNKLALRSLELWQKLQDSTSDTLYVKQGGVSFGKELEIESLAANQEIPNQVKPEVVEKLGFKTYPDQKYVLDCKAGYVNPDKIINLLIKRGLQRGGQIINHCKYIKHEQQNEFIRVYTDLGTFITKKIVLTLGLGIKELQTDIQVELQKQQVFYFKSENVYQNLPIYMGELRGYQIYGFPPINGLMKVGIHHYGLNIQYNQQYDKLYNSDTQVSIIREFFKLNLPLMENAELVKSEVCIYTTTPDHNFVIDFHENKNSIIICACSGHGYKFSICMGEIVDYMFTNQKLLYESFSLKNQQRPKL